MTQYNVELSNCTAKVCLSTSWIKDKLEHDARLEAELMQLRSFGD
jgi:hypothetical protein